MGARMTETVTVDVRDMLCAQALAAVARALQRLPAGDALEVWHNAPDVKRDLLVWAEELGHDACDVSGSRVRIQRR